VNHVFRSRVRKEARSGFSLITCSAEVEVDWKRKKYCSLSEEFVDTPFSSGRSIFEGKAVSNLQLI